MTDGNPCTRSTVLQSHVRGHPTAVLFIVVFAVYAAYLRVTGDPVFYYDAGVYWQLGGTFGRAGHFSLLDYDSTLRGYSLPLLNRFLSVVGSHLGMGSVTIVQLFGSLEIALLGTVLVPRAARVLWSSACVTPLRILLFNAIVFFFWRDYLGFPLSDFPALALALLAILALSRRTPVGYAAAGLAIGLAWNVRPAYILTLVLLLLIAAARAGMRRTPLVASRALGLMIAGVLLASLPQMLINHRHAYTWSPAVQSGNAIIAMDLTFGMRAQRYETYVGTKYPTATVFYLDPSTLAVLRQEHITGITGYSQYAHVVERHPVEMIVAWARRTFNGLDVRYPTVYVHDLGSAWAGFSLANYTLLFAAAISVLIPTLRRRLGAVAWPEVLAFCAACFPAIPFAVESRFFLPLQFVVYAIVVFSPFTRETARALGGRTRVVLAASYPVVLVACTLLSNDTIAQIVKK